MADVTILGAGIFGLSIAWSCLKKGAKVQVIDPAGPGAGASGGVVGALAPHTPDNWNDKKAFQLDSLLMAEGFWAEVADASGMQPGYARLGRLQAIDDERVLALSRMREDTARTLWRGEATWEVIEAGSVPFAPITPTGYLVHDTLSARIHPRQACAALAAGIAARGGRIVAEGALTGKIIHATGIAGLEALKAELGWAAVVGVKGQGAVLDFAGPNMPQLYADAVHIIPHRDGTTGVGSTSEREFTDPKATDKMLDDVVERAMRAVPALRGAKVIERWAGLRPRTQSRRPLLGAHPLHDGEFIANGGFKIGFGVAPKVGEVMADLALDGVNKVPEAFQA